MNASLLSNWSCSIPRASRVVHADNEVAAFGVQEGRDRLKHGVCYLYRIFAILFQVPAQRRFELQRLRFSARDQFLRFAMASQILIEQIILSAVPKVSSSVARR